jgi:hypothetical protein
LIVNEAAVSAIQVFKYEIVVLAFNACVSTRQCRAVNNHRAVITAANGQWQLIEEYPLWDLSTGDTAFKKIGFIHKTCLVTSWLNSQIIQIYLSVGYESFFAIVARASVLGFLFVGY